MASRHSILTFGNLITSGFLILLRDNCLWAVSCLCFSELSRLKPPVFWHAAADWGSIILSFDIYKAPGVISLSLPFVLKPGDSSNSVFKIVGPFAGDSEPPSFISSVLFLACSSRLCWVNWISLLIILFLSSSRDSYSKGYCPMTMQYMRIPKDHMSILGSLAVFPWRTSGDMYLILPALWRSPLVPRFEPNMPKSAILTCTFDGAVFAVGKSLTCSRRIIFWNLMSLCMIRLLWQ